MTVDPNFETADVPPTLSESGAAPPTLGEPVAPAPSSTATRFGDYELEAELARGGMGVVYRARQISLGRVVALKMILSGQLASATEIQRFRTEAEAAARLDHPNIVPIYDVGTLEGRNYFTMKLVEGGSLHQHLGRFRAPEDAAALAAVIARAVHHAHQRGILHRDLKPANILLARGADGSWQPQITDFGLAKRLEAGSDQTHTGAILGTPSYMAPEQAAGKKDAATVLADIYSLGAILYELLTGVVPFRGDSAWETVRRVQEESPRPPSESAPGVDRGLEAICLKCLEKEPKNRYATAEALATDLERWRAGEALLARPPGNAQLLWLWLRHNLGVATLLILIGVICGGMSTALIAIEEVWDLLVSVDDVYGHFPSIAQPWLAVTWEPPDNALRLLTILGMLLFATPGLLVVMVARPKDLSAAVGVGLATGLIAGVAAFTFGIGWAMFLINVEEPTTPDIELFGRQVDDDDADQAELLVERYPDLKKLPVDGRGSVLATKIRVDQFCGSLRAIWMGMIWSMLGAGGMVMAQTLSAARQLRDREHVAAIVAPYLEVGLAYSWAFYSVFFYLFDSWNDPTVGKLMLALRLAGFVAVPLLAQLATTCLPAWLRVGLYLVIVAILAHRHDDAEYPAPLLFAVYGVVLITSAHLLTAAWSRWLRPAPLPGA